MELLGKETFIREKHTETSTEAVVGAVRGMILHGAGAADLSGREKGVPKEVIYKLRLKEGGIKDSGGRRRKWSKQREQHQQRLQVRETWLLRN